MKKFEDIQVGWVYWLKYVHKEKGSPSLYILLKKI